MPPESSSIALPPSVRGQASATHDDFTQMRYNMIVQQIRPWDVLEPRVLDLLEQLPRHLFVPDQHRSLAYVDMELPLGHGQVMLAPKVEARVLQELDVTASDDVLEVGTGSGYMAALLSRFGHSVTTVEKYDALASFAQDRIAASAISNVTVLHGNGLAPDPRWAHRGFDVVVLSGGIGEVPETLLTQLKPGGRLVAFIGAAPVMQATLIERVGGSFRETALFDTMAMPLEDQPTQPEFTF